MSIIFPQTQRQKRPSEKFSDAFSSAAQTAATTIPQFMVGQQQDKAEIEAIKRLKGIDLTGLKPDLRQKFGENLAKSSDSERVKEALIAEGASPQEAEMYSLLNEGAKTEYMKSLMEQKKRKSKPTPLQEDDELFEAIKTQDEGMTPSEKIKAGAKRYETGLPLFKEAIDKLHSFKEDENRFNILDDLSQSKNLPKGAGLLNVDKKGNLRLPFAASKDAQRFVKTLNEAAKGAKGTFGARITDFDLETYMKQFPGLLNSPEAMRDMIEQLKIVNQINKVYYGNLRDVFKKAGGARKIDSDLAISMAEEMSAPKVEELSKKFEDIGKINSLEVAVEKYPAGKHKGKKLKNPDTGEILISDGIEWILQGQ